MRKHCLTQLAALVLTVPLFSLFLRFDRAGTSYHQRRDIAPNVQLLPAFALYDHYHLHFARNFHCSSSLIIPSLVIECDHYQSSWTTQACLQINPVSSSRRLQWSSPGRLTLHLMRLMHLTQRTTPLYWRTENPSQMLFKNQKFVRSCLIEEQQMRAKRATAQTSLIIHQSSQVTTNITIFLFFRRTFLMLLSNALKALFLLPFTYIALMRIWRPLACWLVADCWGRFCCRRGWWPLFHLHGPGPPAATCRLTQMWLVAICRRQEAHRSPACSKCLWLLDTFPAQPCPRFKPGQVHPRLGHYEWRIQLQSLHAFAV